MYCLLFVLSVQTAPDLWACVFVCVVQICMDVCQTLAAEIKPHWFMGFQWMVPCLQWKNSGVSIFSRKKNIVPHLLEGTVWMFVFSFSCQWNIQLGWEFFSFGLPNYSDNQPRSWDWVGNVAYICSIFNCWSMYISIRWTFFTVSCAIIFL